MSRLLIATACVVSLFVPAATAQDVKKDEPKKDAIVPGDVEIHFLNGSLVRMLIQSEKLEVATDYGRLSVPVKDVRAIEFGVHYPEGVLAKINLALKGLGSSEYRERERASKVLVELGPYSYPGVYEACESKDLETSRRAKKLVKQLQANHPKKDLKSSDEDKVVTPRFTIVGRLLTPTVKAKTDLFGDVELALAKMRALRAVGGASHEAQVTVEAAKYANAGQWLETSFEVDGRSPLVITAKGAVDTWPQGPGQYMVGPSGMQGGMAGNPFGGGFIAGRRFGGGMVGPVQGGVLVGKIGEDGEAFMIGDRFEGTPDREGKLYLHIGPSPWGCQSAGAYEVKISRAK
jgi:hypothetical protein